MAQILTGKRVKKLVTFSLIFAIAATSGASARIDTVRFKENSSLKINGPINSGDAASLEAEINKQIQSGIKLTTVQLNSINGSPNEAAKVAILIKHFNLDTTVNKNDQCFDACLIALVSGAKMTISQGALLGLHGIKSNNNTNSKDLLAEKIAEYRRFGVPDEILSEALNKPVTEATWLNRDQLKQMGIDGAEPAKQTEKPVPETRPQPKRQFSVSPAPRQNFTNTKRSGNNLADIAPLGMNYSWNDYFNRALSSSSWQNFGQPNTINRCNLADYTGSNWCISSFSFETDNDEPVYIQTVTRDGQPILHEICQYADEEAALAHMGRCLDWDRNTQYEETRPLGVAERLYHIGLQRRALPTQQASAPEVFLNNLFGVFQ